MLPDVAYQVAERSHNRCILANLQFHEQQPEEKKKCIISTVKALMCQLKTRCSNPKIYNEKMTNKMGIINVKSVGNFSWKK